MRQGTQPVDGAFHALRRFATPVPVEVCELCALKIGESHSHLIEPATRHLLCACEACALLFAPPGARYRRIPRDVRVLPDFVLTDARWDSLLIPIEMAFFFESSATNRIVALYPSPAGATESLLSLATWQDIVADNPTLRNLTPDVEALVVNRLGRRLQETNDHRRDAEYYVLPIDQAFRLVGLIRLHWRGLSGGTVVWHEIATFFDAIRLRAVPDRSEVRA